jgi:DNA-binding CsgD family transcriptional regulator
MPQFIENEVLEPLVDRFLAGTHLTPAERREVLGIARGAGCKDAAAAAGISPETVRARRKRIYRKLGVPGAADLIARLLAVSVQALARGERIESRTGTSG